MNALFNDHFFIVSVLLRVNLLKMESFQENIVKNYEIIAKTIVKSEKLDDILDSLRMEGVLDKKLFHHINVSLILMNFILSSYFFSSTEY